MQLVSEEIGSNVQASARFMHVDRTGNPSLPGFPPVHAFWAHHGDPSWSQKEVRQHGKLRYIWKQVWLSDFYCC